jgi:hypothetical protein
VTTNRTLIAETIGVLAINRELLAMLNDMMHQHELPKGEQKNKASSTPAGFQEEMAHSAHTAEG